MGHGRSSISCSDNLCSDWLMVRRKNFILILVTIVLYIINQCIKNKIPIEGIRWFMTCYFNDTIGGITFMAYCGLVFEHYHRRMTKLWQIILLMASCGFFWEYITPLFRTNTISDPWDILAYVFGSIIYWLIMRSEYNEH